MFSAYLLSGVESIPNRQAGCEGAEFHWDKAAERLGRALGLGLGSHLPRVGQDGGCRGRSHE
jgi:hypothetical protein